MSGGNPAGWLQWVEPCGSTYVLGPTPFRGDLSDLHGDGYVSFDLQILSMEPGPDPLEMVISGPGGSMSWSAPNPNAITSWVNYRIPLRSANWQVNSGTMASILANATVFKIRVRIFSDTGWGTRIGFDNVTQTLETNEVSPASFTVLQGTQLGGNLGSLAASDNNPLIILCDEVDANSQIEVEATSPIANPGCVKFTTETSATRTDLVEITELYDYNLGTWEMVTGAMATLADTRRVALPAGNLNRFVGTIGSQMKARITHIPTADISGFDGWTVKIDQTQWRIAL